MATTTAQRRNKLRQPGLNITNDQAALDLVQAIREKKTIERAGAAAERERKDTLEPQLRDLMGDETQIVVRGQVIASLSSQRHSTIVDLEKLKLAFPEAYAAVVSQKPYRFVQVASDKTMETILSSL